MKADAKSDSRAAARERPALLLGAGTILSAENLRRAKDAGAAFGVAPGLNPEVVKEAGRLGLPFIPGVITPTEIEQAERISAAQCAGVLAALLEHYDFVVADGPVRFDATARAVFDMAEMYVVVLQLLVPAVRNADRLLRELGRSGYNLDQVALVCNRFGRDSGYLEPVDVETTLGRKLAWALPYDWKIASAAVNVGAALLDYAPKSKLRLAFQQMAQQIAARHVKAELVERASHGPEPAPRKKLLSFLTS